MDHIIRDAIEDFIELKEKEYIAELEQKIKELEDRLAKIPIVVST